jgi:uncharacterized damage-inducible protein DinB
MRHQVLLDTLADQRRHVLGSMAGLSEEALRRPVLPSGWTCLSLINHLALDVELFWFRAVVAGQPETIALGDAWQVDPELPAHQILDGYRSQIAQADDILATASLDAAPAWWPDGEFGGWRLDTNFQVLTHVIAETACHAGHLDAARELIDGSQWMVITGERAGLAWS